MQGEIYLRYLELNVKRRKESIIKRDFIPGQYNKLSNLQCDTMNHTQTAT